MSQLPRVRRNLRVVPVEPPPAADDKEVVYEFKKRRGVVRAYVTEFEGRRFANLREFIEVRDERGRPLRTHKGISVPMDDLHELEAALDALRAYA